MRFPDKVTPYSNSVIALFPYILHALEQKDLSPHEILEQVMTNNKDISILQDAFDCLFALGKIVIIEETGVLHYVG
jgi:hypothetical protein